MLANIQYENLQCPFLKESLGSSFISPQFHIIIINCMWSRQEGSCIIQKLIFIISLERSILVSTIRRIKDFFSISVSLQWRMKMSSCYILWYCINVILHIYTKSCGVFHLLSDYVVFKISAFQMERTKLEMFSKPSSFWKGLIENVDTCFCDWIAKLLKIKHCTGQVAF